MVFLIIHNGGTIFHLTVILLSVLGNIELWTIIKNREYRPSLLFSILLTNFYLFTRLSYEYELNIDIIYFNLIFLVLVFLIFAEHFVFKKNKENMVTNIAITFFISIYIGYLLSYLIFIRKLEQGHIYLSFVLFSTWMSDAAAYLVGVKFGKNHIFPKVSPNKTLEGSIGGVFGGVLSGLLFSFFAPLNLYLLAFLGLIISISGQIGDLFESMIKRNFKVKDSGNMIPGHGGILDCMDSILFSVPVLYYILLFIL